MLFSKQQSKKGDKGQRGEPGLIGLQGEFSRLRSTIYENMLYINSLLFISISIISR